MGRTTQKKSVHTEFFSEPKPRRIHSSPQAIQLTVDGWKWREMAGNGPLEQTGHDWVMTRDLDDVAASLGSHSDESSLDQTAYPRCVTSPPFSCCAQS